MKFFVRGEAFYDVTKPWLRRFISAKRGVVVESETGSTFYTGAYSVSNHTLCCDWTILDASGHMVARIQEDAQKRRAGTKKWLGIFVYKTPKPEFIVTRAGEAESCRIETIRDPAGRWFFPAHQMELGGQEYRLRREKTGFWSPYAERWLVLCGSDRVVESAERGWKGATLQSMEFSVTSEAHVWPAPSS